ncbi:MAG: response regulator transcription factor, partial [Nitrospiraceae bacterium]|nr:response regulator transcription factor [Nitrospiraceae bacterium]
MDAKKILVIEDEPDINELICYNLRKEGLEAEGVLNGEEALDRLRADRPDLVLLDLMLPGIDGLELCKYVRSDQAFSQIPLIMLTARSEEIDKILGLEFGADDYVTKPFSPRELLARIKTVLRRYSKTLAEGPQPREPLFRVGDLTIDSGKYLVVKGGKQLDLSALETKLLIYLVQRPGKVLSRDMLLDAVWKANGFIDPRTVDVHIRRLREKIEDEPANPEYILTKRGLGYYFSEEFRQKNFSVSFNLPK